MGEDISLLLPMFFEVDVLGMERMVSIVEDSPSPTFPWRVSSLSFRFVSFRHKAGSTWHVHEIPSPFFFLFFFFWGGGIPRWLPWSVSRSSEGSVHPSWSILPFHPGGRERGDPISPWIGRVDEPSPCFGGENRRVHDNDVRRGWISSITFDTSQVERKKRT